MCAVCFMSWRSQLRRWGYLKRFAPTLDFSKQCSAQLLETFWIHITWGSRKHLAHTRKSRSVTLSALQASPPLRSPLHPLQKKKKKNAEGKLSRNNIPASLPKQTAGHTFQLMPLTIIGRAAATGPVQRDRDPSPGNNGGWKSLHDSQKHN